MFPYSETQAMHLGLECHRVMSVFSLRLTWGPGVQTLPAAADPPTPNSPAKMSLVPSMVVTRYFWRESLRACEVFPESRSCPRFRTQWWFSPELIIAVMIAKWCFLITS